jgi:hypothetical protein
MAFDGKPAAYSEGGESLMVVAPSSQGPMGIATATSIGSFHATRVNSIRSFLQGRKGMDIRRAYVAPSSEGCTRDFGGTSAAAPQIAGVVALMLEANPSLTWKDVQDVLIRSAEKPHLNYTDEMHTYRHTSIRSMLGESADETIQENFYIFFDSPDPMEWLVNEETGLHHSFLLGFGLPDPERAVDMAIQRRSGGSIDNDHTITLPLDRHDYMENGIEDKTVVGFQTIGVWVASTSASTSGRATASFEERATASFEERATASIPSSEKGDFIVETVELSVNATFPESIDNAQLAVCDHQKMCSLFLRGKMYNWSVVEEDRLVYTFTSVKHWGQVLQADQGWTVMLRNMVPHRFTKVTVHSLELRINGHYVVTTNHQ